MTALSDTLEEVMLATPATAGVVPVPHPDGITRAYVGTPLGAPTREGVLANFRRACYCVRLLIDEGFAPVAPHLLYSMVLDEHAPEERELGIALDLALMPGFQRVILFTPDGTAETLTRGMKQDLARQQEVDARLCALADRLDERTEAAVWRLVQGGLPVEYRLLPDVPVDWSPSFLTPGGFWLTSPAVELIGP